MADRYLFIRKSVAVFLIAVLFANIFPAVALAHHSLKLEVDKPNGYYVSAKENVKFTITNSGDDAAHIHCTGVWVYDINSNLVAWEIGPTTQCTGEGYTVDAGASHTWNWNQKDSKGNQVANGKYYGYLDTYDANGNKAAYASSKFNIDSDADGDGVADGADACRYVSGDGPDGCSLGTYPLEIQREVTIGFASNQDSLGDPDNDGVMNYEDLCPYSSGTSDSKTGRGCPDPDVKASAAKSGKDIITASSIATVAGVVLVGAGTFGAGAVPGAVIFWAVETTANTGIAIGAAQKIAHDPPDMDYAVYVTRPAPQFRLLEGSDAATIAINNLILPSTKAKASAKAFVHANEKLMGAQQAGDYYWIDVHTGETKMYAKMLATDIKMFNDAVAGAQLFIFQNGANVIVTRNDLIAYQDKLRKDGIAALPQFEVDLVKNNLGGSDADVRALVDSILSIDASTFADVPANDALHSIITSSGGMVGSLELIASDSYFNVAFNALANAAASLVRLVSQATYPQVTETTMSTANG